MKNTKETGSGTLITIIIIVAIAFVANYVAITSSINQRIDHVNTLVSKLNREIGEMKTEMELRFTAMGDRLIVIETGISSLRTRDDSIKEYEPSPKPIPIPIPSPEPGPKTIPYQEDESGPQTIPYQKP